MKEKKATIYDVAKFAGVSTASVSRVINHPEQVRLGTRQHIYDAMKQCSFNQKRSYQMSSQLKQSVSKSKCFLLCIPTIHNPFYSDIVEGATSAAANHGHHLLVDTLSITTINIDAFLFMLKSYQIDGIILMLALPDAILTKLYQNIPLVQCSEYNEAFSDISYVSIDDTSAEYKATEYALSTGHQKIAFITSILGNHYANRRYMGLQRALNNASIHLRPDWVIQLQKIDFSLAYNAALKLLSNPDHPDAILTVSDTFAAACIRAAMHLGIKIPQDLIVIGFDNTDITTLCSPTITTISQPRFQLGYAAFEMLLHEIEFPQADKQQLLLPTELIIRESTIGSPN